MGCHDIGGSLQDRLQVMDLAVLIVGKVLALDKTQLFGICFDTKGIVEMGSDYVFMIFV